MSSSLNEADGGSSLTTVPPIGGGEELLLLMRLVIGVLACHLSKNENQGNKDEVSAGLTQQCWEGGAVCGWRRQAGGRHTQQSRKLVVGVRSRGTEKTREDQDFLLSTRSEIPSHCVLSFMRESRE